MKRQARAGWSPSRSPARFAPGASAPPEHARRRPAHSVALGLIVSVGVAAYWSTLHNPLVFDDRMLREDFLRHYAASGFQFELRWISNASFAWVYQLFGRDWFWQRLGNVLLHGTVACVLYLFQARLFDLTLPRAEPADARAGPDFRWFAFFGAMVFLLHPVAAYGVAYLAQRSIELATLFSLASLWCFLEALHRRTASWHIAAAVAFFAAVLSKEHAVMLPAVAVTLAVVVRGPSARLLRELWLPMALLAAIAVLVTLKAQGKLGAPYEPFVQSLLQQLRESHDEVEPSGVVPLSVLNQMSLFFRYLLAWCVPYTGWMSVDLRPSFPTRLVEWGNIAGFAGYAAYAVVAAFLLRMRGIRGLTGFVLLCPWLLSITEVATVRLQEPLVLYRSYLWMAPLAGMFPLLLARALQHRALPVLAVACIALIPPLYDRLETFSSPVRLWEDAILKQRDAGALLAERAWHNRGFALLQDGRHAEALRDFNRAIELNPADADAFLGRGVLSSRTGRHAAALADLDRALELDPGYAEAFAKRCFVKMMLDQPADAVSDCERAVRLDPGHRDARTNLGVVYAALGRVQEAETSYRQALVMDPGNGDANYNYGVLLAATGRAAEARQRLAPACDARIKAACRLLSDLRRLP
jgi:Tfp pilus assembly protein PilF